MQRGRYITGEETESPSEKFGWGQLREGARGLFEVFQTGEDEGDEYGIDWEAMADRRAMRRVLRADDAEARHQIVLPVDDIERPAGAPLHLAHVPCEPGVCPLDEEQLVDLERQITASYPTYSDNLLNMRQKWITGLEICRQLSDEF